MAGAARNHFNLARYLLEENARQRPEKIALVSLSDAGRDEFSYERITGIVLAGAARLQARGGRAGDRLLIRLPNGPEYAFAFFAAIAAGLVAVPASPQLTATEAGYLARDGEVRWILHDGSLSSPLDPPADASFLDVQEILARAAAEDGVLDFAGVAETVADDPAFLIYTSGTTGYPRGVLHAQRVILGRRPMGPGWTGLQEDDRLLHAGQLNWTYTMGVGVMDPFSYGAAALLWKGDAPDPARWPELIRAEGATIFAAVPGLYRRILKYGDLSGGLPGLRHGLTAGEALRPELHSEWRQATGSELYEALGMSEVSTYISSGPATPTRPGSPGRPQPGRRVAVLPRESEQADKADQADSGRMDSVDMNRPLPPGETGLLAVHLSDPGLLLGYWRDPEADRATRRGEWFIGGDVVHQDRDGYIHYHERDDEMMNSFGYRVSPLEVERVLSEDEAVLDVAVVEKRKGEVSVIAAFVVPAPEAEANDATRTAILARAARLLAEYKRPRELSFLEALPRGANGKLKRRDLV